jgi:peptidoglycan/LPS O-acetylase OafA/YrhL
MSRTRLDTLTGLRFPAALAVFVYHAGIHSEESRLHDIVSAVGGRGYAGVSFFFILSGFVLTWSHRDDDTAPAFYRRRFARIAPVYWLCLAIAMVLLIVGTGDAGGTLMTSAPSVPALQAWFPQDSIHFAANGPGWSISAEMFFYAMFPLLAPLVATRTGRRCLLGAAIALVVLPPVLLHPAATEDGGLAAWIVYVLPVTRLGDFIVGILLAGAISSGWRPPLRLPAALALAVAAYTLTAFVPIWATVSLTTLVPFALVIAAAAQSDLAGVRGIWSSPVALRLGEWSFAFYLIHSSVLKVQHEGSQRLGLSPPGEWATIVLALVVSVVAAALIYRWVEAPLERRLRHATPRAQVQSINPT